MKKHNKDKQNNDIGIFALTEFLISEKKKKTNVKMYFYLEILITNIKL